MKEKIKEKMFRLHKHKSSSQKSGERIDFSFSGIQALQVPKGWDKLYVSLISVETNKTIAKSGKASVRNGHCRWTDALSESIWISQIDALESCLFKFLVSMGSARSGILGEAAINLAGYMSTKTSIPISLPLKNCNHGTVLRVDIQCLTPRAKMTDDKWRDTSSCAEDAKVDYDEMENKSDVSDCTFTKSVESSSSYHLGSTSHLGELGSRATSVSASHRSFDSVEDSLGRECLSPKSNLNGFVNSAIGRQNSTDSQTSGPFSPYTLFDSPRLSNNSGLLSSGKPRHNQIEELGYKSRAIPISPLRNSGSSKNFMDVGEVTVEELRVEARMWERNARKLMLDMETLKKEFDDQSKHLTDLEMELSASHTESDGLKQEIERLKAMLDESTARQEAAENLMLNVKDTDIIKKELEDELRFQKQSNDNLVLQLKKTQESNLELVSVLQEMEETIGKQKTEIEKLSPLKSKLVENFDGELISSEELYVQNKKEASCISDLGNSIEHPEIDFHTSETEVHLNVDLQIHQLQESLKNMEMTILHLEKSLKEKDQEIEIERDLSNRSLLDCEAEWRSILTMKDEEIINLEVKLSEHLSVRDSKVIDFENKNNPSLIEEIEVLKEKVQELERDCNELTEENLNLLFKLKRSRSDLSTSTASLDSSSNEGLVDSSSASDSEVSKLRSQIWELKQEMKNNVGENANQLQIQCIDLKNKCTDLELEVQCFKDKAYYLDGELQKFQMKSEEQETEISMLRQQLQCQQDDITENYGPPADAYATFEKCESKYDVSIYELCPALCEQLRLFLVNVKKQHCTRHLPWRNGCQYAFDYSDVLEYTEPISQKKHAEIALEYLFHLNNSFETKFCICSSNLQCGEEKIGAGFRYMHNKVGDDLEYNMFHSSSPEPGCLNKESELHTADLSKELLEKTTEISKLKAECLIKEKDIDTLRCSQRDLESQISDLLIQKCHMDETMETMQQEGKFTSQCLENLKNDMLVIKNSIDSHISVNKILEKKSMELESDKIELDIHLSELEKENVQLSERISGLEAQLRYFTDARESIRLELQHSEIHVTKLQDEIGKLENEMEGQKFDMKQKLQDMQKRWLETQAECEYLKQANPKLQATAESLIEEYSLLEKSNGKLREQRLELHKNCTTLESKLRRSQNSVSESSKKIEALETKFSLMLDDIASKERYFGSELEALHQESNEYREKLVKEENLLDQMYLEKVVEVENLQRQVDHLNNQVSATHDEMEREASKAVLDVHTLRAEKDKLEVALQEIHIKVEMSEQKHHAIHVEYEDKLLNLMNELATSTHKQKILTTKNEELLGLLNCVRSDDNKLRGTIDELESKLQSSDYEKMRLGEEISSLKIQFPKIPLLQDEVLDLKNELIKIKFENERLDASLHLISRDYEEVKADKVSLLQQISGMQIAVSELEDCRQSKTVLEEKILRLEGDLTAKEALSAQDAELKNDLGRLRRVNSQLQWKIKYLEEENKECQEKVHSLEGELKHTKEVKQGQLVPSPSQSLSENDGDSASPFDSPFDEDQHKPNIKSDQPQDLSMYEGYQEIIQQQTQFEEKQGNKCSKETTDSASIILSLENELVEALEANDMYKAQLKSLLSSATEKSEVKGEAINREENERKVSMLEAEFQDLSERYLHMSLKYAEVEAQREQLVMKLKAVKPGKN